MKELGFCLRILNMKNNNLVYSTDHGQMCPGCNQPKDKCICKSQSQLIPTSDGIVRIARQTKGRKGKGVSIITGIPLPEAELKAVATTLKTKCGTGGTCKNGTIEIQGDNREKLKTELEKMGYKVKLAGG